MRNSSLDRSLKVGYLFHRFPNIRQTYLIRELLHIQECGVEVKIFTLMPPKDRAIHDGARSLLLLTQPHVSFLAWSVIKAQLYFLRRSPKRYLRALAKTVWQTYPEPLVLLLALALFPKSVYFAKKMKEMGIDHIHAHFAWLGGIAAGAIAELIDVTFSIHPHAFDLFSRNQRAVRRELETATKVVTISNYHRAYITDLCSGINADEIEIIYNGVETDYYQPVSKLKNEQPIRILSVGWLVEKKGFEYLIEACRILAERELVFQCRIVGDGPLHKTLQTHINRHKLQDQVSLLGAMEHSQVLELYQTSDIFALACITARNGDQDGVPTVLTEAMACGLPVVTTPLTGIPDLVQDGGTGIFVQERDAAGLADALERLIVNDSLRRHLGTQARQFVLKEFQTQHNVAKLANVFRHICQQH